MTFSLSWVLPRLSVGSAPQNASDVERLRSLGVTHVLDVREERDLGMDTSGTPRLYEGSGVTYHRTPMHDDGRQQAIASYVDAVRFIGDALAQPNSRVFVHCAAGMYRSPSVIYAALRAMGYDPEAAWRKVVVGRSIARDQYVRGAEASVPSLPRVALAGGETAIVGAYRPSVPARVGVPTGAVLLGAVGIGIVGVTAYRLLRRKGYLVLEAQRIARRDI